MTMLEELFYGNINPCDKAVKKGSRYAKLQKRLCDNYDGLRKSLTEKDLPLLDAAEDAAAELSVLSQKESFADGFRLGARLMLEIFFSESQNLTVL